MTFSVLGEKGFIGSELVHYLEGKGYPVETPSRKEWFKRPLGDVIYCIGITSDFRLRPLDAVEAHVTLPLDLLRYARFESFLYLSSTRVYKGRAQGTEEEPAEIRSDVLDDIYSASKIMGEAMCIHSKLSNVRIVRLSNVVGGRDSSNNFLTSVIRDAVLTRKVKLETSLKSEKDYILVEDVVEILPKIAVGGRCQIYNVASGKNVTNRELLERLADLTGCDVDVKRDAPTVKFPLVNVDRAKLEFDFNPQPLLMRLPDVVSEATRWLHNDNLTP